ncbi:related to UBC6 - E2 ubiquitin-conjugating enzyme [Melanopsichium pennsylvanicum]|uniref:Related to UBC6 - E2 ubiquitin-conjugating enzyme n=1 Tax=Melanopsichium pennsylvanicum TaxID=63383 RepID=A0AAJ5C632_9BASI|nr:related to UBC6 - E2 ubiquitin-conjugating enzyme [Melanopsichium pennsylvanicum]
MATTSSHNKKSSSVKRILSEARELSSDTCSLYTAHPLEDNIFEWHFTLRGPPSTEFCSGLYHGRILLPAEYPFRPPDLMLLTPNGRWELNKKICLTFTGFHEEMWQPAWGIRTALLGLQTFMTAKQEAAVGIGSLEFSLETRQRLANESRLWKCHICEKTNVELLPDPDPEVQHKQNQDERLPEGLQVDLSAKSHKPNDDAVGSSQSGDKHQTAVQNLRVQTTTTSDQSIASVTRTPASELASTSNITPVQTQNASTTTTTTTITTTTTVTPVAQHQISHLSTTPIIPTRASSTSSTPTPPSVAHASQTVVNPRRTSTTQQKLVLIDNCIKGLSILITLLVVKRLI